MKALRDLTEEEKAANKEQALKELGKQWTSLTSCSSVLTFVIGLFLLFLALCCAGM